MKKIILMQLVLLAMLGMINAQTVDSIRVEQTGDLVKIHYKILNSKPEQIFRVSVLCSMNGGLKSVLNSLSGDFGDNVVGGRNDYMVLWDVLKDVDELKSAEFFVKAELIKDLSIKPDKLFDTTRFWASKRYIVIPQIDLPGPRLDLRIGYIGSFGISVHALYGNVPVFSDYESKQGYSALTARFGAGIDLTKCIISKKYFQAHLVGGFRNNDIIVYYAGPPNPQFWYQGADGPEFGTFIAYKRIILSLMYYYYNPKQPVERNNEPVILISPNQFFNFGLGMRF